MALGFCDVIVESTFHRWDVAALIPVIEGAGGIITNWQGGSCADGGQVPRGRRRAHPRGRDEAVECLRAGTPPSALRTASSQPRQRQHLPVPSSPGVNAPTRFAHDARVAAVLQRVAVAGLSTATAPCRSRYVQVADMVYSFSTWR